MNHNHVQDYVLVLVDSLLLLLDYIVASDYDLC